MAAALSKKKIIYSAFAFAAVIVVLLIVSVILLAVILSRQNNDKNNDTTVAQTTVSTTPVVVPVHHKKVVVLVDASQNVTTTILANAATFLKDDLGPSLLKQYPSYTFDFAAAPVSTAVGLDHFNFVDLTNTDAVQQVVNSISTTTPAGDLDLSKALTIADQTLSSNNAYQDASVIVIASSTGTNYAAAIQEASKLKTAGSQMMALSLSDNGSKFKDIASDPNVSFDGRAIVNGSTDDMQKLSGDVAGKTTPPTSDTTTAPPVTTAVPPVTTAAPPGTTATVATTTSTLVTGTATPTTANPASSSTTSSITATSTTASTATTSTVTVTYGSTNPTIPPPDHYRIMILVDASSSVTQKQIIQQANFVYNNLVPALENADNKQSPSFIQIVPYAFDLSPDVENYVPLNDPEVEKQYKGVKLAKITTFTSPLDRLFFGQTLKQVQEGNSANFPSHIITLISSTGNDFADAKAFVYYNNYRTRFVTAALSDSPNDFLEICSTPDDLVRAARIYQQQDLEGLAKEIVNRIFPKKVALKKHTEAPKQEPETVNVEVKPEATTTPTEAPTTPKARDAPTPAAPVTSTDIVVLVDVSKSATDSTVNTVSKQTEFVQNQLYTALDGNGGFADDASRRIIVIPYAFFSSADMDTFVNFTNKDDFTKQITGTRLAPITTFQAPLDELQIAPTLQLLAESTFVVSTKTKVILMACGAGRNIADATQYVSNFTSGERRFVVVALNGKPTDFTPLTADSKYIVDGSPVKGDTDQDKVTLATHIVSLLKVTAPASANFDAEQPPILLAKSLIAKAA